MLLVFGLYQIALRTGIDPKDPGPQWLIAWTLADLMAVALFALWLGRERAGLQLPRGNILLGAGLGLALVIGPLYAVLAFGPTKPFDAANTTRGALAAITEEITYRGIMLALLAPLGARKSALLSTLLFGLSHFFYVSLEFDPLNVVVVLLAWVDGVVLAGIRLRTGSILICIAAHLAVNVCLGLMSLRGIAWLFWTPGLPFWVLIVVAGIIGLWRVSAVAAQPRPPGSIGAT